MKELCLWQALMYDLCSTHLPAEILARYFSFLLGLSVADNSTSIRMTQGGREACFANETILNQIKQAHLKTLLQQWNEETSCILPDGNNFKTKFTRIKDYKIIAGWYDPNMGEMQKLGFQEHSHKFKNIKTYLNWNINIQEHSRTFGDPYEPWEGSGRGLVVRVLDSRL